MRYEIQMRTPMGIKRGEVFIEEREGRLAAELTMFGERNQLNGSAVPEYACRFTGSLKTAVGEVECVLQGSLSREGLEGVLRTEKGDFPIWGQSCPAQDP